MSDPGGYAPTGESSHTETMVRALLPDGTLQDNRLDDSAPFAGMVEHLRRSAYPAGTRFEMYERTVTTVAGDWELRGDDPVIGPAAPIVNSGCGPGQQE